MAEYAVPATGGLFSNVGAVLDQFQTLVEQNYLSATGKKLPVVFDPSLEYSRAVAAFRSRHKMLNESAQLADPIFIYNRTPLHRPSWGLGRRNPSYVSDYNGIAAPAATYKGIYGVIDIGFGFACTDMNEMENLEILYMAWDSIRRLNTIPFTINEELGSFNYYLFWDDIDESPASLISETDIFYKMVTGTIQLYGWFFLMQNVPPALIKSIQWTIESADTKGTIERGIVP